jgi:hypothetical protein
VHLADCPDCVRDHDLHQRLNSLPVPSLSAEWIAGWRAVALSDSRAGSRQRMRRPLVIVCTLVAVAAAAAMLVARMSGAPEQAVAEASSAPQSMTSAEQSPAYVVPAESATPAGTAPVPAAPDKPLAAMPTEETREKTFTVLVLPVQIEGEHPVARTMGEEYYAKLLGALRQIPGLALVEQERQENAAAKHVDFRLTITSAYGKVPDRFGGHEQWRQTMLVETFTLAEKNTTMVFSNNPDCGRISLVDVASVWACSPAGLVETNIRQLRRNIFPPDPATARQLQARFIDATLPQGVRRQALADLLELRQRSPEPMDTQLIRVIIQDAIANATDPVQRVNLWRALRGQPSNVIVQFLVENLRRETDDKVRLEMVGTLVADFSKDPVARAELELVAKRDTNLLVRMVADRAISGEAAWRTYVVSAVKNANLPAAQRFEPLGWMVESKALRPSDTRMDLELAAITRQLMDDGNAVDLAEVLVGVGNAPDRAAGGTLQIMMTSVQHPAVADLLIAIVKKQADFSTLSLLGRHRSEPRIEEMLKEMAASHPNADVRRLAAAQLSNH